MNNLGYNITVTDQTAAPATAETVIPLKGNVLIIGSFERGPVNTIRQYYAGEMERFKKEIGLPNIAKYGEGLDIALSVLDNEDDLGVMIANLRPDDATAANVGLIARVKVLRNEPKLDKATGQPLYRTPGGQEVITAAGNTPIVRDVLEAKYEKVVFTDIKSDDDLRLKLDALYDDADAEGYEVIPMFAVRYCGTSKFGNLHYFRLISSKSEIDGNNYYTVERFDGDDLVRNTSITSFFPEAAMYNKSVFIENVLKNIQKDLRPVTSIHFDKLIEHLYAYVTDKSPLLVDIFDAHEYQYRTAADSLDVTRERAFVLQNGSDGTASKVADSYNKFLTGVFVPDIYSPLVHRIDIIPDLAFPAEIKTMIETFIKSRKKSTVFITGVGNRSFESGIAEYLQNSEDNPFVLQVANAQSPTLYNQYAKRSFRMSPVYYTVLNWVSTVARSKTNFASIAGADCRWSGFDPETLLIPLETEEFAKILKDNRINYVKRDRLSGAYMFTQYTRTKNVTDLSEFSNIMMVVDIVYDIINLIHKNRYTFNDAEDVRRFQQALSLDLQPKYSPYSTFITAKVFKKGTTGEDKNTNVIKIYINFKDLFKDADVEIIATDKQLSEL